jgi:hypothetical protein
VESLKATSFDSNCWTSSTDKIPAKSLTSLGGSGRAGISWEYKKDEEKRKIKKIVTILETVVFINFQISVVD